MPVIVCYRDVWVERITTQLKIVFTKPEVTPQDAEEKNMTPFGQEAHYYSRATPLLPKAHSVVVMWLLHVLLLMDVCDATLGDILSPPVNILRTTEGKLATDLSMVHAWIFRESELYSTLSYNLICDRVKSARSR